MIYAILKHEHTTVTQNKEVRLVILLLAVMYAGPHRFHPYTDIDRCT